MTRTALLLLPLFCLGLVKTTTACSCKKHTIEQAYDWSDLIAVGRVLNVETVFFPDTAAHSRYERDGISGERLEKIKELSGVHLRKVTLKVNKLFKGVLESDEVVCYTGVNEEGCGFNFLVGLQYIVYGDSNSLYTSAIRKSGFPEAETAYITGICNRTRLRSLAEISRLKNVINENQTVGNE
jgi:hypothetical protein